jgi:integrase
MPSVGRKRQKNFNCPAGVRPIKGRWYWQPTSHAERRERKAKGLPASVPLGKAGSVEARRKWAELTGLVEEQKPGTIGELLTKFEDGPIKTQRTGLARSENTVKQYRWRIPAIRARFGSSVYARTELDILRGKGTSAGDIQRFITESGSLGRPYLAILDGAFHNAILCGLTTYNPCEPVYAPRGRARTREPLEWEMECLGTVALPHVALIIEYKHLTGYRISEILRVHRRDMTAKGIRHTVKGGKTELCAWSPGLRAVVAAAELLPRATRFPKSPLFPNSRGRAYTYSGWDHAWQDLKAATNAALAAGVIDVDTLERHAAVAIEDLHVHDVRSKVHDDAEEMGREGHEQLGNTEGVADRHYSRREKLRRPLK